MSMIRFLWVLLLIGSSFTVPAQTLNVAPPAENTGGSALNPQNVLWLAFLLDQTADRIERAKSYLEVRELQRYASNMHNEEALLDEARIKAEEIDAELRKIDRDALYTVDLPGLAVAAEGRMVTLSTAFNTGIYSIATDFGTANRYFPPMFEFIIANVDAFQQFEVSQGRSAEYQDIITTQGPQAAYMRAHLQLVSFQQGRRFQTVIRRIEWFSDFARTKLISEVTDKRRAAPLIARGPLSEGATFEASPEHAYLVAGERILETFPLDHHRKRTCNEGPRERGHRVFTCTEDRDLMYQVPVTATYHYVGGRLVEVRLRLRPGNAISAERMEDVGRFVQRDFSAPVVIHAADRTSWRYGAAQFHLDLKLVAASDSSKDFLVARAMSYDSLQKGEPGTEVVP